MIPATVGAALSGNTSARQSMRLRPPPRSVTVKLAL